MTTSRTSILAFGSLCLAFSLGANAGGQMSDKGRITNGGTGYIGLTESAGQPRHMNSPARASLPAGEASTMVNGRPNQHPNSPINMAGNDAARTMDATRAMGASSMGAAPMRSPMEPMHSSMTGSTRHPMWGTPD
jgi:hypothetical protein